ncbi:ATP-grasp domain-containing protein [Nitrosospira briensis]|uniref:ATP-grasp domain-containing protein n=1 Tax=Nitrosospira briensis TaxID=35799 RepID=UPI00046850B2|nr:ATP-grasp domain-containing protein [Nitrosospira briensis]
MHKLEVLLIGGYWPELMMTALGLLTRTGFTVDVISTNAFFKKNRSIRDYFLVEKDDLVKIASEKIKKEYTLVVIADDPTLGKILNSNLSNKEKLALLPVSSDKHFAHIFSKIGLSQAFKRSGLLTPDFRIANDEHELKNAVRELGHPVVIKLDSSSGGVGVFESSRDDEFGNLITNIKTYPVLVQKKIKGVEVSIEAFYQNGRLIHFACSIPEKYKYKFGPTSVRRYVQLSQLDEKVFEDLRLLGRALGADGFVNISSIRSDLDQKLYFFEADMRPNLWINHSRYFGDDPAKAINSYFSTQEILKSPYPVNPGYPEQILLSHPLRISLGDLILNHHQVWRHLPENFLYLMLRYRFWAWVTDAMAKQYKRLLPKPYRALVKKHLSSIKYSFSSGPGYK